MKPRKTSIAAYHSISLESKKTMWAKIIKVLKRHRNGLNYSEIAGKIGAEPVQVARRLNELVQAKVIENTKETRPTSSGRQAMVRKLNKRYAA